MCIRDSAQRARLAGEGPGPAVDNVAERLLASLPAASDGARVDQLRTLVGDRRGKSPASVAPWQYALAACLLAGRGVARDEANAARLLRTAANAGFAPAFAAIGLMHRDGLGGCARDARMMQAQFKRAVDHGYPVQQARSLILDTHHAARF